MQKKLCLLLVLVLTGLMIQPAFAAKDSATTKPTKKVKAPKAPKEPKAPKAPKEPKKASLRGYYAVVASKVNMTEEQKEKFAAVAAARSTELSSWGKNNTEKVKALRSQSAEAKKAGDKDKATELNKQLSELYAEKNKISDDYDAKLNAVLTQPQRVGWESLKLKQSVSGRFKKVGLTDEQDKQIETLCDEAAAGVEALDSKDRKALGAVKTKLYKDITEKVLTDAQREAIKPAAKPAKPAKPAKKSTTK